MLERYFEVSPVKIRLTIGNVIIVSKLIDADFPDYLGLIPANNSLYFNLSSVDMARAVDRVSTIMMEKSQAIKFSVNQAELELSAGGNHQSLANEKLEIESNIEQFEISFNAKYLLDIMAVIDNSDDVEFRLSDPFSAVLVRAKKDGVVKFIDATKIIIESIDKDGIPFIDICNLNKYPRASPEVGLRMAPYPMLTKKSPMVSEYCTTELPIKTESDWAIVN